MTTANLEDARPQLLAIAEALDNAAHSAYKQADELLERLIEATDDEIYTAARRRNPVILDSLPELRRLMKDDLEKTQDAAKLFSVAYNLDADASDECGPGLAPWWVRQVENRFETIERLAAYTRGIDYDTGDTLDEAGLSD